MANLVNVIGVGPGNPEYLMPKALEFINKADVLVGGERNLELFPGFQGEKFVIHNNLSEMISFIKACNHQKQVVVLASGDPGLYGIVAFMSRHFSREELNVIPGISAIQLAFARLAMPWQDAVILSTHGREISKVLELIATEPKVALFTDTKASPATIARELLKQGIKNKKGWICANLSYTTERIIEGTLAEITTVTDIENCILILLETDGEGY